MSRFSRAEPTTVALIYTPLQAINLLEFVETTGHEPAVILVGKSVNGRNSEQIAGVLAGVDAEVVATGGHSGVPRPGTRQDAELAEIVFYLGAIEGPIRMVFGEYRSSLAWRLIRRLDLSRGQAIFVDDGAATLSIDRLSTANDVVLWNAEEAVAPVYGPGTHLVTTAGPTRSGPSGKALEARMLADGDQVDITAVIREGNLLWGLGLDGEFVRMAHVLWQAPLPEDRDASIDVEQGTLWVSDPNYAAVAAVTFFTSYVDQLRAGPKDRVIANTFPRLKRLYRDLEVDPARTIVIGCPLQVIGMTRESIRIYTLELLALARDARPEAEVVYVPHRAESDDDIEYLDGVCRIERFDIPFELVPLSIGYLPGLCATFYSSLSLNLLDLVGARLAVVSLRLDPDDYDESRRATIERVYERIATHPSGSAHVVASAG